MKVNKAELIERLTSDLLNLYRIACDYEQDDTPKLSAALNRANKTLNYKVEAYSLPPRIKKSRMHRIKKRSSQS